jgi:hypothetical protein
MTISPAGKTNVDMSKESTWRTEAQMGSDWILGRLDGGGLL